LAAPDGRFDPSACRPHDEGGDGVGEGGGEELARVVGRREPPGGICGDVLLVVGAVVLDERRVPERVDRENEVDDEEGRDKGRRDPALHGEGLAPASLSPHLHPVPLPRCAV